MWGHVKWFIPTGQTLGASGLAVQASNTGSATSLVRPAQHRQGHVGSVRTVSSMSALLLSRFAARRHVRHKAAACQLTCCGRMGRDNPIWTVQNPSEPATTPEGSESGIECAMSPPVRTANAAHGTYNVAHETYNAHTVATVCRALEHLEAAQKLDPAHACQTSLMCFKILLDAGDSQGAGEEMTSMARHPDFNSDFLLVSAYSCCRSANCQEERGALNPGAV